MADTTLDAVVIGGGPAGAVCAVALAKQGDSVMVLERQTFPRFHIGEPMLPYMAGLLGRPGLLDGRILLRKNAQHYTGYDEHNSPRRDADFRSAATPPVRCGSYTS
jgi:flavin-dependent dehydrogenase